MSRLKRYVRQDVLEEARRRVHYILDTHDSAAVCFSGGKDSLATLLVTRMVYEERGMTEPIKVIFRDEETVAGAVLEFVDSWRQRDGIDMTWLAVPLMSVRYCMGVSLDFIQWEPGRTWLRPKPDFAWTGDPDRIRSQYDMDELQADLVGPGKVALLTGIRSSESLIRFRASVNKLNDNFINASSSKRTSLCKPLFDWEENDVFRLFYETGEPYCEHYDFQLWARMPLRVATPFNSEVVRYMDRLAEADPVYFEQLMDLVPAMRTEWRYGKSVDKDALKARYLKRGYLGIRRWVLDHLEGRSQKKAMDALAFCARLEQKQPGTYPASYVLHQFMNGAFKRDIMPLGAEKSEAWVRKHG